MDRQQLQNNVLSEQFVSLSSSATATIGIGIGIRVLNVAKKNTTYTIHYSQYLYFVYSKGGYLPAFLKDTCSRLMYCGFLIHELPAVGKSYAGTSGYLNWIWRASWTNHDTYVSGLSFILSEVLSESCLNSSPSGLSWVIGACGVLGTSCDQANYR